MSKSPGGRGGGSVSRITRAGGRKQQQRLRRRMLQLPLVALLGSAGWSEASTPSITELVDAGGKLASAGEVTSLLRCASISISISIDRSSLLLSCLAVIRPMLLC